MASSLNPLMLARRLQFSNTITNTIPIPSPLSNSGSSFKLFSRSQLYPIVVMLFIIAVLSLYLKHCWTPTPHPFPAQNNTMMTATAPYNRIRPSEGLDANLVASFPLVPFPLQQRQNIERESCGICLEEYRSEESLRRLPCCSCLFHPQCIKSWFNSHTTCPLCRHSLTTISPSLPHHSSASPQPMVESVPSVEPLNLQVELCRKESRKLRRWHSMDNRNPQLLLLTKSGGSHDSSSPLSISNTTSQGTSDNPSSSHVNYGKIHPHMKDKIGDNSSTKYLSRSSSDKLMMRRRKDRDGEGSSSLVATMPLSLSPSSSSMKKRNPTRFAIHNK